jgi:hypothetical protein
MARYTGPRIRIIRRLGLLPGLTRKSAKNRTKTPGQHGKLVFAKTKRSSLSDDYKERLLEKQKLRFNYGVTEKQLVGYFKTYVGGFYLHPPIKGRDDGQEFEYHITDNTVKVIMNGWSEPDEVIFEGSYEEFFDFCQEKVES